VTISAGYTDDWPALVSYRDLPEKGLTRFGLDKAVDDGVFERIAPGLFARSGATDDTTLAQAVIALKRPASTLCLLSAAALHDLTDEIPRATDVAIPRGTHPIKVKTAPVEWHRFDVDTFDVGRGERDLFDGLRIGLYSPQRTIVDLFRLRHIWGQDLAIDVLKRWLRRRGSTASSLLAVAKRFPAAYPAVHSALEVLL
jgi:predicted transcriptional regulator of viral defense system